MTVKHVGVQPAITIYLQMNLVHKFLALFQAHINHQLLNGHELTLIESANKIIIITFAVLITR